MEGLRVKKPLATASSCGDSQTATTPPGTPSLISRRSSSRGAGRRRATLGAEERQSWEPDVVEGLNEETLPGWRRGHCRRRALEAPSPRPQIQYDSAVSAMRLRRLLPGCSAVLRADGPAASPSTPGASGTPRYRCSSGFGTRRSALLRLSADLLPDHREVVSAGDGRRRDSPPPFFHIAGGESSHCVSRIDLDDERGVFAV